MEDDRDDAAEMAEVLLVVWEGRCGRCRPKLTLRHSEHAHLLLLRQSVALTRSQSGQRKGLVVP